MISLTPIFFIRLTPKVKELTEEFDIIVIRKEWVKWYFGAWCLLERTKLLFVFSKRKVYWNVSIWLWFAKQNKLLTCFCRFIIPNIQSILMNNLVWYHTLCVCMYALYSFKWFFVLDNGQPTVARGRFRFLVSQWISLFRCARNRNPSWGRACFWMNSDVSALFFRLHHTRVSKNNSLVL
jgi:hypothetical protein